MILKDKNLYYYGFRRQFRVSFDWSLAKYNGFKHIYKVVVNKFFPGQFKEEHILVFAQVRGCKFHFFKNAF